MSRRANGATIRHMPLATPSPPPRRVVVTGAVRLLLLVGALQALSGCMTVRLEGGAGQTTVTRHVGVLRIELAAPPDALVGTLQGVGVVASPLGTSAGWTRQRFVVLGPQCRAVVFLDGAGTLDDGLRRSVAQAAGVCLIGAPAGSVATQEVLR